MNILKKSIFIFALFLFIFASFSEATDIKKIGIILYSKAFYQSFAGFRDGLKKLGYIENKNIIFYIKNIKKDISLIKPVLGEFYSKNVDLIFTTTTPVALTVKKYINNYKIPVIFNEVAAPLRAGIVKSLEKPGGYITGISHIAFDLIPKRLEVFKDAFPFLNSIIFFYNPKKANIYNKNGDIFKKLKLAASKLNLKLYPLSSKSKEIMKREIENFKVKKGMGIFMFPDADAMSNVNLIINFSRDKKLPLMVFDNVILPKGGCIGYSPSFYSVGKQSAFIAKQIFSGIFPGNIPVQFPDNIELVVNYREIKKIGLEFYFNKNYLDFANKVIK